MDSATMINLRSVVATKSRDLEVSPALVRESLPLGVEERNRFEQFLNEERPPVREQKAQSNDEKPPSTIEREEVRKASDNEKTKEDVSGNDVSAKKADSGTRAEKESQASNEGEAKEKGQKVAPEAVAEKKSNEAIPAKKVSAKTRAEKKPSPVVQEEPRLTTAKSMQWKPVAKDGAAEEKSVSKDGVADKKVPDAKAVKDAVVKTITKDEAAKTVALEKQQPKDHAKIPGDLAKGKAQVATDSSKSKSAGEEQKNLNLSKELKTTAKSAETVTEKQTVSKASNGAQKSEPLVNKTETDVAQQSNKSAAKSARPAIAAQQLATQGAESSQENIKSLLNSALTAADQRLAASDKEIGIKGAVLGVDNPNTMLQKGKEKTDAMPEKGFLKGTSEPAASDKAVAVQSRADGSGQHSQSFSQQHQGQHRHQEFARQWLADSAETRQTSQSATQSQFIDRAMASQLSPQVVNQIVSHIERMRESGKNRVKVSLGGSEASGVSIEIQIDEDGISATFEGNADVLDRLKDSWDDIRDQANRKGIQLKDPKFISYSSSAEDEFLLPDADRLSEEKSQSVIQHKDNQPVRPNIETAVAGSSSSVHLYA